MKIPDKPHSVSVIIPVFNGESYISKAIDSVLGQNLKPVEIIVIDDGSTDKTAEVCARYKNQISYFYKDNGGEASARNAGFKRSRGTLLAYLDADDEWLPTTLEVLQSPLLTDEKTMLCIGHSQDICKIGDNWERDKPPYIGLQLSASMLRRTVFDLVGLFEESLQLAVDTDWLFRVRENRLSISFIDQTVVYYRRHGSNASLREEMLRVDLLTACRSSLTRRREKGGDCFLPPYGYRRSAL